MQARKGQAEGCLVFLSFGLLMLLCCWCSGCFDAEPIKRAREIEHQREEKERCLPRLISNQDGLNLYRIDNNCAGNDYPIFFSRSGTETTQHWTTHSGKTTHHHYRTVQVPTITE